MYYAHRFDERRRKMEDQITEYYSKFKEIYTKENYPEWFNFVEDHKRQFGKEGYNKKEHELGHYAILQTPIPENPKVVMVGKNNSWFIPGDMKKSLEVVKALEEGIPDEDHFVRSGSNFANRLNSQINKIGSANFEAKNLLVHNRVGINRLWLQTGTDCPHEDLAKEIETNPKLKQEWAYLKKICHEWTEEIIRIINPGLVILFGSWSDKDCAWNLFNKKEEGESFVIKHCPHPSGGKNGQNFYKFQEGIEDYKKKMHLNN